MCYQDLGEELTKCQLEFRKQRRSSREKSLRKSSRLVAVTEGEENRARNFRLAACMLVQIHVRAVRAANTAFPRPPQYLRPGWVPPTLTESAERLEHLARRFPEFNRADILRELSNVGGHGGYAAAKLLERRIAIASQQENTNGYVNGAPAAGRCDKSQ